MTRLLYLADGTSVHTKRWIKALTDKGCIIHLFSLNGIDPSGYDIPENKFSFTAFNVGKRRTKFGGLNKFTYLTAVPMAKKIIRDFRPDIVHAHFASSYGLLGALTKFHPFVISVWGYDVFSFPGQSFIHRHILKNNLKKADAVLSTSEVMARETQKYTNKKISVTPFGVDMNTFQPGAPLQKERFPFREQDIIIGTVKPLESKYAIDHLFQAFALVKRKHPELPLKCCIVGEGSQENSLKKFSRELKIDDSTYFTGQVPHNAIPGILNRFDIFAALSLEESFGVVVIEASACEIPVVVSDEGGLPEVVEDGQTGFVVPKGNVSAAARKIEDLVLDTKLREKIGKAGRRRVLELYSWQSCVQRMQQIYKKLVPDVT